MPNNNYNLGGSAYMRMQNQGYTKEEMYDFKDACYMADDKLLDKLPCRCAELPTQCELCRFKELRDIYNPHETRGYDRKNGTWGLIRKSTRVKLGYKHYRRTSKGVRAGSTSKENS